MYLQGATFDGSAALEKFGQIDTDRLETRLTQLLGEARCGGGEYHVEAVGDGVEAEHVRVGAGCLNGIGKQFEQRRAGLVAERRRVVRDGGVIEDRKRRVEVVELRVDQFEA